MPVGRYRFTGNSMSAPSASVMFRHPAGPLSRRRSVRVWCGAFLLGGLVGLLAAARVQTPAVLTNVAQIRALSADEAARKLPVRIRGVVTFMDPDLFVAFIRDETGSAYFSPRNFPAGPVI
jgi:hypothetical protein